MPAGIGSEVVVLGKPFENEVPKIVKKVKPTEAEGLGVKELKLKIN